MTELNILAERMQRKYRSTLRSRLASEWKVRYGDSEAQK